MSPSSAKDDHGYMSPSIPSEIGSRGNFHAYFINDTQHEQPSMNCNQEQSSSASCLGISRPTYESPDNDKLDFSPILQSRKRINKIKSALDKYQNASTSSRSEMPQGSRGTNTSTTAGGMTNLATAVAQAMQQDDLSRSTAHEGSYSSVSHTKSPTAFRNPIKALKQATRSRNLKRSISMPNGEENSISTLDMDGSIDMYRSVTAQVKTATQKKEALNNDRFFTPAQQCNSNITPNRSFFNQRRQRSKHVNNVVSSSTTDDDDVPRLCSATSDSQTACKGQGIGIAPPPNSSTSRIIVPYVTPDDTKSKYSFTVFILLIQPTQKIFELVRVNYDPSNATLQHLLDMIPSNSSEEDLSNQTYVGLVRPNASSSSNKSLYNLSVTASVMARDGSCARIVCGEVLAAIPKGYTGKETQILARHIMKNPKMIKLLSKKNLSSRKKQSSSSSVSSSDPISSVGSSGLNGSKSQLGIQGKKDNYVAGNATGTFSSSVLFAPLSNVIQEEEEVTLHSPARQKQERNREIEQERIRTRVFFRNDSERKLYSGDVSCSSSITSIQSSSMYSAANVMTQRCELDSQVVTNIEMKDELHSLDRSVTCPNNSFVSKPSKNNATPLIIDNDCGYDIKHQATDQINLSASMLEEIKREATEAARVAARAAAEEAFSKRMAELMQDMNVSDDEKNRLLDNDDLSFHSAISFAMSPLSSNNDTCDFPVSVSISEPPLAPSAVRSLTPYGSHGASASEVKFVSPYTQGSSASVISPTSRYSQGRRLLAPKSSSPVPQLAQVSPQSSDGSLQKSFEQESPYSYPVEGRSRKASYSQSQSSSFDEDDDVEVSLIAEVLEGFYEVTKRAVSTYLSRKKRTLRELPSKLVERNMHLKIMSIVCVIFLSYNHIIGDDKTSFFGMNQDLPMFQSGSVRPTTTNLDIVTKRKFSVRDLQQILFWFLLFTKGQHFLTLARPQRRHRRAWKSRVIPVN